VAVGDRDNVLAAAATAKQVLEEIDEPTDQLDTVCRPHNLVQAPLWSGHPSPCALATGEHQGDEQSDRRVDRGLGNRRFSLGRRPRHLLRDRDGVFGPARNSRYSRDCTDTADGFTGHPQTSSHS
jgi:hypothetical protein